MTKHLSAEDIFPLVDCLSTDERLRLHRFLSARTAADDQDLYRALPPRNGEFSGDENLLGWDADGWDETRRTVSVQPRQEVARVCVGPGVV